MGDFVLSTLKVILQRKKCNMQQENNAIVNIVVNEIIVYEPQKVSFVNEAPAFLESEYDENKLYQVET